LKYQKGDHLVVTHSTEFLINPFMKFTLSKGYLLVVDGISVEYDEYYVSRKGTIYKIPADKLEPITELEGNEDKQYSKVVKTDMSYGEAMFALINQGKKVTRKVWDGYWLMDTIHYNGGEPQKGLTSKNHAHKVIMAKLKTGGFAVASPYQEDMLANDWMIVE
jgi:gamma-glutamylcyclotransferase (GGCT)/AIG2-like uncharacterized protein YtfP